MKNAGMAGAVALVGIGLITIGMSNFANRADATPATPAATVNAGPEEPVIVAFGSLGLGADINNPGNGGFYRLWSTGESEVRLLGFNKARSARCGQLLGGTTECGKGEMDSGWILLASPPGGEGFACRTDINGDRDVNAEDLGLLLAQWGQEISCDPQPSYPCFDLNGLNGLNMNIAAR